MGDLQTLMDMGFPKEQAEYALKVTSNKGVEPAMEWLLAHADEKIPIASSSDDSKANAAGTSEPAAEDGSAKSLKCDECGKLCANQTEVEYHATKMKHFGFSESTEEKKPLTEDEKKMQLALIEEKLKQKRVEREEREKTEALEREKNRIKSGKDMTEARKRMEEIEMKKLIDQQKREKAEEKQARDRVRAQIEADKAARKARESNETEVVVTVAPTSSTQTVVTASTQPPVKTYTQTRLQIRLIDGNTLTETFSVKEQLSAVRVFIQVKTGRTLPFGLMTSFPRKLFQSDDYEKPLEALGLVPSAVLIMTKISEV